MQRVGPADRRVGYGASVMDPETYREPGIMEARCQEDRDRRLFSENLEVWLRGRSKVPYHLMENPEG